MEIKRGQIYYADLSPVIGSEQGGLRPVLIISNDIGNRHAPIVIAATITSQIRKYRLPTQVLIHSCGLRLESMVECEQIRTLDKRRLLTLIGTITDENLLAEIDKAIKISLGV